MQSGWGINMSQESLAEIWGYLDYIGLDAEGNVHIIIKKQRTKISGRQLDKAIALIGKEVRVTIKKLWG